jgi:hypothetical protein
MRARSYEEMNDFEKAADDYTRVVAMNENSSSAKKLLTEANDRLFAINRENNSPEIFIETPTVTPKTRSRWALTEKHYGNRQGEQTKACWPGFQSTISP